MSLKGMLFGKKKFEDAKASLNKEIAAVKKEIGLDKNADQFIQKSKMENVLIIRMQSYSVGTIAAALMGTVSGISNAQYQVVTKDGEEIYISNMETTMLTNRDIQSVYDMRSGKRKIGSIKQWVISGGIPLLEKEAKTCTVTLEKDKLCDLKKYVYFGDLKFETLEGRVEIKIKSDDNYSIYYKGKKIAELHELPIKLKDGYVDRYVLEYKEPKDQQVSVMMAIAVAVVNS